MHPCPVCSFANLYSIAEKQPHPMTKRAFANCREASSRHSQFGARPRLTREKRGQQTLTAHNTNSISYVQHTRTLFGEWMQGAWGVRKEKVETPAFVNFKVVQRSNAHHRFASSAVKRDCAYVFIGRKCF